MFEDMMSQIRTNVSRLISFIEIRNEVPKPDSKKIENSNRSKNLDENCLENSGVKKISRNARCLKTGKKYKNCCGKLH